MKNVTITRGEGLTKEDCKSLSAQCGEAAVAHFQQLDRPQAVFAGTQGGAVFLIDILTREEAIAQGEKVKGDYLMWLGWSDRPPKGSKRTEWKLTEVQDTYGGKWRKLPELAPVG